MRPEFLSSLRFVFFHAPSLLIRLRDGVTPASEGDSVVAPVPEGPATEREGVLVREGPASERESVLVRDGPASERESVLVPEGPASELGE